MPIPDTIPPLPRAEDTRQPSAFILIEVIPGSPAHESIAQWCDGAVEAFTEKGLITLLEINDHSQSGALTAFAQMLGCVDFLACRLQLLQIFMGGRHD